MNKLIESIEANLELLKVNSAKLEKGNKSAAARARAAAMQISKDCKDFRVEATNFKNKL